MKLECWNLVYIAGISGILCGGILVDQIIRAANRHSEKRRKEKQIPMRHHLPPSWNVQSTQSYLSWCDVHVCRFCGQRGHGVDMPQTEPCPGCGAEFNLVSYALRKDVGRWDPGIKMWILKGEDLIMLRRQAD